jgi:hypothetical protein
VRVLLLLLLRRRREVRAATWLMLPRERESAKRLSNGSKGAAVKGPAAAEPELERPAARAALVEQEQAVGLQLLCRTCEGRDVSG